MWIGVMPYVLMNLKKKIPLRANKLKPEKLNLIRLKSQNIMACMLLFSYRHASHCKPYPVEGMDMWLKAFLQYFFVHFIIQLHSISRYYCFNYCSEHNMEIYNLIKIIHNNKYEETIYKYTFGGS